MNKTLVLNNIHEKMIYFLKNKNEEAALSLMKKDIFVNYQDVNTGNGFLHFAVGQPRILRELIAKGINVNVQNKNWDTPLHVAFRESDEHTILTLLQAGALWSIQNVHQQYPFSNSIHNINNIHNININNNNNNNNNDNKEVEKRNEIGKKEMDEQIDEFNAMFSASPLDISPDISSDVNMDKQVKEFNDEMMAHTVNEHEREVEEENQMILMNYMDEAAMLKVPESGDTISSRSLDFFSSFY